ncbi:3-methyladenine DNA glycosylase [Microbacterium nymphoidis]|uniref:3-methyladenine DNA glycosylase n=1 Tax=Microbacterium nymphoidis TaxID=2898586 RepID=UPI001E583A5E|nr:3-methyladenine DNA glycosylase [Microbacterium nymphoidis]MCD2497257.1 3-methyladenine DNA glycosylase [Microbacterium nymphoidis]
MVSSSPAVVLPRAQWRELQEAHVSRADQLTAAHRERAARREKHPVWDFLFTYYSYKPSVMRRWHPGAGAILEDAADSPHASWRWYAPTRNGHDLGVDVESFWRDRGESAQQVLDLLSATSTRPARFGCFGMHEWAMVYRQREHRHDVPLRLGQTGTDAVVEAHELRCTHFDAFRFFTPEAEPRNEQLLTRASQPLTEQPGCLHAGMDLYKWALKLGPLVPGPILLDSFELARDIRELDMRASPYDLAAWGFPAVPVETPEGKADYVRQQRAFAERGQRLRDALIAAVLASRQAASAGDASLVRR